MRSIKSALLWTFVGFFVAAAGAASSWNFEDASVSVQAKGSGGGEVKHKLVGGKPLFQPISLTSSDTLRVVLTTVENGKAKRPHQAFLAITEPESRLEMSYPLKVMDSGKAKLEMTLKDLPAPLSTASRPLGARILIASFGSSRPFQTDAFTLELGADVNTATAGSTKPLRYGKREPIHHIFRADPRSPAKLVTLFFTVAILAAFPILLGTWMRLGANLDHLPHALADAPIGHALFFGSIVALEGIFFLYYTRWNLFQTLPATGIVGFVTYLSGSRALTEVQDRRLVGKR